MLTSSYSDLKELLSLLIKQVDKVEGLDLTEKIRIKNHLLNYEFIRQARLKIPE